MVYKESLLKGLFPSAVQHSVAYHLVVEYIFRVCVCRGGGNLDVIRYAWFAIQVKVDQTLWFKQERLVRI